MKSLSSLTPPVADTFITEDFLLQNEFARRLYHDYALPQPIIDYHNHLPPAEIAADRQFEDLTAIWLAGDHYKWRAMRTLGISEEFITGSAGSYEKFQKWAHTVPYTMRNPLYHWTHLELKRYFDVDILLGPDTARDIFDSCTDQLQQPGFSARSLLTRMNVEVVCTTDDPVDNLAHHQRIQRDNYDIRVIPAFRPDKVYAVEQPENYLKYIGELEAASGLEIRSFDDLLMALEKRIDYFHANGCRLADHGIEHLYHFEELPADPAALFKGIRNGSVPGPEEASCFRYAVLIQLCRMYHAHGWTQQFHLGALRNNSERMFKALGPDSGFDSIGDSPQAVNLSRFLNVLDRTNQLTRTVLYNVNPSDNEVIASMIGNFNDGSVKGKMQFGSAWWFLDQKDGMEKQINTLSNVGLLSCFIGMLTDSRSFLSFPRHEYFRRILCNLIGEDVANGELPGDEKWLGKVVADICYFNAKSYFNF